MDYISIWMIVGFLLASYSVIANDSVQTLGTWIASNQKTNRMIMWAAASAVLLFTIWFGWYQMEVISPTADLTKFPSKKFSGIMH